jgi:serine/threonine-protein kinase RsbT
MTVFVDLVVAVYTPEDIVTARQTGRNLAVELGFSLTDVTMIATAISEVARNITSYAGTGEIRLLQEPRQSREALIIRASDNGPGIADITRALEDGYSSGGGLGLGLPGARRLVDHLEVTCEPGHGTLVEMWKWLPPHA